MSQTYGEFLCAAAYVYITDPDFQVVSDAAGIDWFNLPDTLDAVKIVRRYLAERAAGPHASAIFKIRDDLRFLETAAPDFRSVPNDSVALAHEFKSQSQKNEFENLGRRLIKDPARGQYFLDEFSPDFRGGAQSAAAEDLVPYYLSEHRARVSSGKAVVLVEGFEMLCYATECCNPEHLTGVLGSTGFGKTNFGMNLALRFARTGLVGYVNMEMGYSDMTKRMVVIGTHTSFEQYRRGEIDDRKVKSFLDEIRGRFHMTSGLPLSFPTIKAWAKSLHAKGLKLLVVDYDQKIELSIDRNTPEWKALQKTMYCLESLAKELKIAVIVFAQVNREGEISGSHRSTFSADTMISFEEHPIYGPVLWAKKNRHGLKNAAITVEYDQTTATIREQQSIIIDTKKLEVKKPEPKRVSYTKQIPDWSGR